MWMTGGICKDQPQEIRKRWRRGKGLIATTAQILVECNPVCIDAQAEIPASGSDHLQSQADDPIWPESSAAVLPDLGPKPMSRTSCGAHSMTIQAGKQICSLALLLCIASSPADQESWPGNLGSQGAHPTTTRGQGAKPAALPSC